MEPASLETVARWAQGALKSGAPDVVVETVCTDSRALKAGDLFVALRGDRYDGHIFVNEAALQGAAGAIVETWPESLPVHFGVIVAPDALAALQRLAAAYRASLPLQVVGITGSNGKTSTKDLTASVLEQRYQVTKTAGNLNNHIGLPLTILRARGSDAVGVFEMGMNHPGEIAPLAAMARPDVAIITNIGMAHIEHMGSREAIALEKGMLAEALSARGTLIMDAGDKFARSIAKRTAATAIYTGIDEGDIRASNLSISASGTSFILTSGGVSVPTHLPVPGEHMVRNALLAAAAGRVLGLGLEECAAGIRNLTLTKGRLERKSLLGIEFLDDSYNANPDSVRAALSTLAALPAAGRRIAVLGRMGELGREAENGHRSVGEAAAVAGLDYLITVGSEAQWIAEAAEANGLKQVTRVTNVSAAVAELKHFARRGDLVLVKGSRSEKLERIVEGMIEP